VWEGFLFFFFPFLCSSFITFWFDCNIHYLSCPSPGPYTFKRRELATSMETRTRFPELVIQEEKRVRFVVVNGLRIVEKPNNVPIDDAEW